MPQIALYGILSLCGRSATSPRTSWRSSASVRYIGATGYLNRRIWEHREGLIPGFTKKYGLKRLVWYEPHEDMGGAFQREKSLKRWPRQWKINLIERENPHWDDLYAGLV